jgi:hypothetical protein
MHLAAGKIIVMFHFQAEVPPAEMQDGSKFQAEVVSSEVL